MSLSEYMLFGVSYQHDPELIEWHRQYMNEWMVRAFVSCLGLVLAYMLFRVRPRQVLGLRILPIRIVSEVGVLFLCLAIGFGPAWAFWHQFYSLWDVDDFAVFFRIARPEETQLCIVGLVGWSLVIGHLCLIVFRAIKNLVKEIKPSNCH